MRPNIWIYILLTAVLLVEISCYVGAELDEKEIEPGLKGWETKSLERRKRAPKFSWGMNFRPMPTTPQGGQRRPFLDFLRSLSFEVDRNETHSVGGGSINLPLFSMNGFLDVPLPTKGKPEHSSGGFQTTTARPMRTTTTTEIPSTTERIIGGCILPDQPTGGSFHLTNCAQSCTAVSGSTVPSGSMLIYICNEGYTLIGHYAAFCSEGDWYMTPTCAKTCPALKSNSLDISCSQYGESVSCESEIAPGTKASFACKHSYKLPLGEDLGIREITCLEGGLWDRNLIRCVPECGTSVARGNPFIVNGVPAERGVFPWHVAIYEKGADGSYEQICAGSLISANLVVSAGHCFYDDTTRKLRNHRNYMVAAGKYNRSYNWLEEDVQTSAIKDLQVAPRYIGMAGNFADDIAVLRLQNRMNLTTSIRPICMDFENTFEDIHFQPGRIGKAVGWGKTESGSYSQELQELSLPYISYDQCSSSVPQDFRGYLTRDKFCAGWLNGSSLCDGDSGGGLAFQIGDLWFLRGIVSVGPVNRDMCDYRYYTAFTNVGTFADWIRSIYVQEE